MAMKGDRLRTTTLHVRLVPAASTNLSRDVSTVTVRGSIEHHGPRMRQAPWGGFLGMADTQGRQMFACPHCGHELSMFRELRSNRLERIAVRSADIVGSWPYLLFLLLAIVTWCLANIFMELFQPHPSVMLGYLGTILTIVAVLQGPLILLTQRREANRDRARDIESFYIAQNAEADLHSIKHAVNAALERRGRAGPTDAE